MIGLFFSLMVFVTPPTEAQPLKGAEYTVKAAFIYNFAKFVEWPEYAFPKETNVINLCIASPNRSVDAFFELNDKIVRGKPPTRYSHLMGIPQRKEHLLKISVKKCETAIDARDCHILFIGSTDEAFVRERLNFVKGQSVLTVGEMKSFTELGGIINFFMDNNRLRFEVNLEAAQKAGLQLSSQLLMSAEIVNNGR